MNPRAWGPIKQLAYVVDNLDASIQRWIDLHGVGPWTVYRNASMHGHFLDVETTVKLNVGLSYQHDLQIELIEPLGLAPSPYQDSSGRALLGMHHIAWHSDDLDRDLIEARARGLPSVFEAGNGAVRIAYLASRQQAGMLFEFIETTPQLLAGFAAGLQASRDWDGISAPVTVIDLAA
ncbi:MAG: hypothetical protein JWR16_79 [Nevskia sp.]|nr:hypothetical protein [Nevskia sp.]